MYFFPETVLNGNNERVYSQFRTGTLWQKAQEEVGSEKTIVGFGLYSDEAKALATKSTWAMYSKNILYLT
jgi:hypothetical protein